MSRTGRKHPTPARRTIFDDLDEDGRNLFCTRGDLTNEAAVERFFCDRLLAALGYQDHQIKPKTALDEIAVGRGRKREQYKPDYAVSVAGKPRWILDAKHPNEDPDRWFGQCSGYALALNQKYDTNPVQFFLLSNGLSTSVYRWDSDSPLLHLDFADFNWGRPGFERLKELLAPMAVTADAQERPETQATITLARPTTEKARHIFAQCHKAIWKAEVCSPSAAFMAFVKVMFVKLWADRQLRNQEDLTALFEDEGTDGVRLSVDRVIFSVRWIEKREAEGDVNPIDTSLFASLRDQIEQDIQDRRKKRIFESDEAIGLRPDTVKDVVRRLERFDLFGIDEDLNGRLFETFLSATMRGQALGQYFTPRSVVKMMTDIADLTATPERLDRVIDACCGTGGFLIEALTIMRSRVRRNGSLSNQQKRNLIKQICTECLFGIDAGSDPPLARIARINMYLHGDGGTSVYYCDALDKEVQPPNRETENVTWSDELRDELNERKFDVALTNPPFSMTKEKKNPGERRVLEKYELARASSRTVQIRASLRSNVMFIERYHGLLRSGGRLITVIDDSLLANPQFAYVRDFIRSRFLIRAIISLPGDTFRRQGSRVKTSVLVLEKRRQDDEEQPDCFGYFSRHIGVDDLTPRATTAAVQKARGLAQVEAEEIVSGFRAYLTGQQVGIIVPGGMLSDRLDLKYVAGQRGQMTDHWRDMGLDVRTLESAVTPIEAEIRPSDHPNQQFTLASVSYDGFCQVDKEQLGREVRPAKMRRVSSGLLVFSTVRATDGAIAVVPPEFDGALVSASSYVLLDCGDRETTEYVRGILRSHEIRAELQSLSHGSSRYTTRWEDARKVEIPWPDSDAIHEIGAGFIEAETIERRARVARAAANDRIAEMGVESNESLKRFAQSKAPT